MMRVFPHSLRVGLLTLGFLLPSCALAVGAAIGAGAVYSLGEDGIQVFLDAPMEDVLAATQAELADHGEMEREDIGKKDALLESKDEEFRYTVTLKAVTESTTELVIRARRWAKLAPAPEEAKRLADRIAFRLDS